MNRRSILKGAIAASVLPLAARAQGRDLTVVSWGGAYQDAQREVFFRPFQQQTRTRLLEETWDGGIGVLRSRIASGANTWDIVQVESEELLIGAEEGLFEPMDWAAIGGRDAYIPQAFHEYGVGAILYSFIFAYDRARMAQGPANWAEFFDTARFPGKRGLRRGPKTTLEIALMADGVAPDRVYATLGTAAGVDRAFRKLDSIKGELAWWERGAQPPQWLAAGEVALTVAYNGRIAAANATDNRDFAIVWTNNLYTLDSWVIMKGSPNRARALDFLRFAGQPEVQAGLPPRIPYGVTARGANDRLPAALLPNLPTAPQNLESALQISDRFWLDNLDRLTQRFNTWVAR
ncbi:ABC transporter substrate-binding protein [Roseomonas alkaliterrae]|jgi:putative spermidine/putrescine transport system substrate-binding protein|uniref:Putative spermidine/putrescine transport system substrate-binding protein n=1 Tax=Neoroseomonas alkaliterrae TaxID=1452450 RepID=A0A840XSE4_9PROT|nr:ABC transporter substrate-binding protein [Neoroseomonas alkaliterrae]MBB5691465.1 putative spermidine/putrescine transport system substrate-binding protein [Neoroseomonas alkaliterrae]MBR0675691.1 ABC transporter substrate-binding protein [Neoroseomonas alkaliterrae]